MAFQDFENLRNKTIKYDKSTLYRLICKNIKKFRVEKYNEYKSQNPNSTFNPYTSENIAVLLDYSHTHYKRYESENDNTKTLPLEKFIKLAIIFEKDIDDFIN